MKRSRKSTSRYLGQIKVCEIKIQQKKRQLRELELMAGSGGAIRYDRDRVVSSPRTDLLEAQVIRLADLDREIKADIVIYQELKNKIINEIHQLDDERYITVLHKTYVEHKGYNRISDEMRYSVDHVKHLLADALDAFCELKKRGNGNENI